MSKKEDITVPAVAVIAKIELAHMSANETSGASLQELINAVARFFPEGCDQKTIINVLLRSACVQLLVLELKREASKEDAKASYSEVIETVPSTKRGK